MEQTRQRKQGGVPQVRRHPVKGKPSRNTCLPSSYKTEGAGDYTLWVMSTDTATGLHGSKPCAVSASVASGKVMPLWAFLSSPVTQGVTLLGAVVVKEQQPGICGLTRPGQASAEGLPTVPPTR